MKLITDESNQQRFAIILEDHKLFADVFSAFLTETNLFADVAFCDSEKDLIKFVKACDGSEICLFLDYYLPDGNPLHLISDISKYYTNVKIIVVSSMTSPTLIKRTLSLPISAFISKIDGRSEIMDCMESICKGKIYVSPAINHLLGNVEFVSYEAPLTPRELEILRHVSLGKSTANIALHLSLSKHTVMTHRKKITAKLNCGSMAEAVAQAFRAGLISSTNG